MGTEQQASDDMSKSGQLPNCISVHARITDPDGMGEENRDLSLYQEHAIGMTTAHALGVQESSVLQVSMGGVELDLKGSWLTEEVETDAVVSIRVKGWGGEKGTWTEHKNIDMCGQGDIQIIPDWKKSHTLDQLKAIVEENGYSAVCVAGNNEFGHAAIKSFDYQLTAERCKPSSGYTCTIWIYQRPKGVKPKPQMPAMVLTSRGSYNECRFTEATMVALKSGQEALLSLESHPGYAIGKMYTQESRHGPWRYIESQAVPEDEGIPVRLEDGAFIALNGGADLVFDVSFWKMEINNTVNFVGGTNQGKERTKLGGGGRDFVLNDDATISPKNAPQFCLGLRSKMPKMVLTAKGDSNACVFEAFPSTMRLRSHPGFGVGFKYSEERRFGPWRYIESELVAATDAVHAKWDGDFVMISGRDLCLDVAHWKMEEGNTVNFVGGTTTKEPTKKGGGGRDWVANKDGTISAKHHPHLVLGLSGPAPSGPFAPKWCQQ